MHVVVVVFMIVYNRWDYCDIIKRVAEESIYKAVEEVKTQSDYTSYGEVYTKWPSTLLLVYKCTCMYMYVNPSVMHTFSVGNNKCLP